MKQPVARLRHPGRGGVPPLPAQPQSAPAETSRPTSRKPSPQKAFATLYAIILLGLLASAIALLAATLTTDTRRTSNQLVDAQLRALLRAAADTRSATLPPELTDAGFSLTITPIPDAQERAVRITARHATRSLSQTLQPGAATLSRP